MGNKKNKRNLKKRKNKYAQPLPPLSEEFKQNLYLEALEGIDKMKLSKDLLLTKSVQQAYLIDKRWFDQWKLHVGYDAVMKGEQPNGKKYGRQQLGEINKELLADHSEFHDAPIMFEYLNPPLRDIQPIKDYILIIQDAWEYFYNKYKGIQIIRQLSQQGEFKLKLISPYVIYLTQDKIETIQSLNQNQLIQVKELVMRKIQVFSEWNYNDLMQYFKSVMEEIECNTNNIQIWLINPILEKQQAQVQLMKTIHNGKFLIFGNQLNNYEQLELNQYLKNHFLLLVIEGNMNINSQELQFKIDQQGCCYYCGSKSMLNYQCACKCVFYCCDICRYKDQEFHSRFCNKAYDSEDDEIIDSIQFEDINQTIGVGLVNLGNTCYMNSSIQALFSSINLQKYLSNKLYWNQNIEKRNIQLNYKFEKLLKHLLTSEKSFSPYSFRQQLSKKYPSFGQNYQQDAAEFILYLIDAFNEELLQKKVEQQISDIDIINDQQQEIQQQQDDSDDSSDEDDKQTQEIQQDEQHLVQFTKKMQQQQMNNDNYQEALEQILKCNSQLIQDNFLGITKSEIECPICTTKTYSYEPFLVLPLSLLGTHYPNKQYIDIYVISNDWFTNYTKIKFEYESNTLLMDLKSYIGEQLQIIPSYLLGAICNNHTIETYLFHDEETVQKVIKDNKNGYFCLFHLDQDIQEITDDDQYFDVSIYSFEKKNAYSIMNENIAVSIPKILVLKKLYTSIEIYQQIWKKLNMDFSNQLLEQEEQQQNYTIQQIKEIQKFNILIETRLPSKTNCPFSCGKQFKKEIKAHQCEFPFSQNTLDSYLQLINYKNAHTSFLIEFQENSIPQNIRIEFDQLQQQQKGSNTLSLESLLEHFQLKEALLDENAYHCTVCNDLTFAVKTMSLQKIPNQLIIQLKRFQFDNHQFTKNNILVNYPLIITINNSNYHLYGVVQHFGTLDNGHYTAYGLRNQEWIEFNDSIITQVKEQTVINDKNAYILFYQLE